jgi:hypothetical protein
MFYADAKLAVISDFFWERADARVRPRMCLLLATSSLEAQSPKSSSLGQTKRFMLDANGAWLQQISSSLEALAKRVSPSIVRIFSTGYNLDSDREHTNTDLLSRGSSLGSGLIIATEGWVVTNAHVVQGGRRIHVRLNQGVPLSTPRYRTSKCALIGPWAALHELRKLGVIIACRAFRLHFS